MLPNGGQSKQVGPYDDRRSQGPDISLPQISNSSKHHQVVGGGPNNQSYNEANSVGRQYAYKSNIDQQNTAMIAKLMSRKKSYERMMKVDDGMQSRTPNMLHPELTQKKNQEVLMTANRGGAHQGLSRANGGNSSSTRKQLQYYDSTPQREQPPRKHAGTVLKKQLITSSNNQGGGQQSALLDVTGQNLQKPHGKSSAYLPNSGSAMELQ